MFPLYDINRSTRRPFVNYILVLLNIIAFVLTYFVFDPEQTIRSFGFIPADFVANPLGKMYTVLTSMFLHGGLSHILGNLWFLWVFGDNIEDQLGHLKFIAFYILGGVAAALSQALIDLGSHDPMVGASGAIAAVMGAYLVLFPHARVRVLLTFYPLTVPAIICLGYWILIQIWQSTLPSSGVALWAHIGGFIFGAVVIKFASNRPQSFKL